MTVESNPLGSLLKRSGSVRTDMDCHECSKRFIAELDHDIDGNHTIECPWCGHGHCRVIKDGVVTGDRWSSTVGKGVECRRVWKHNELEIKTSVTCAFIRDRWLNAGRDE